MWKQQSFYLEFSDSAVLAPSLFGPIVINQLIWVIGDISLLKGISG